MLTFLKFVGAAALVVVVLIVLAFYWLKRKIGKAVTLAKAAMQLPMPGASRVTLQHQPDAADQDDATDHAAAALHAELLATGFSVLGRFDDDAGQSITAFRHEPTRLVAALVRSGDEHAHCEYYAIGSDGQNSVLTTEAGAEALALRSLSLRALAQLTPRQALATLADGTHELRSIDAAMFVLFYERLYATRMDQQLRTPPTIDALLRKAALRGSTPTLSEAERNTAIEMAMNAWLEAVEVAVKDNARRQLRVATDVWSRIDGDLRVVHAHLDADQAIEAHHGDDLIARLGEQLKLQNLTPVQVFDEINRRRPAHAQLQAIARVGMPIAATVYATEAAMHSIGLGPAALQGSAA